MLTAGFVPVGRLTTSAANSWLRKAFSDLRREPATSTNEPRVFLNF